jgi:ABC-type lipoprotein export system ATPase subunit
VPVYRIKDETASSAAKREETQIIGYNEEKEVLIKGLKSWMDDDQQMLTVIEGESGSGKTTLLKFALDYIKQLGAKSWYVSICISCTSKCF